MSTDKPAVIACSTCKHWTTHDSWESKNAGMKQCKGIRHRDDIELEIRESIDKDSNLSIGGKDTHAVWDEINKKAFNKEQAYTEDASDYKADLITAADFFCAKHDPVSEELTNVEN